jgi:hypothetical protein
VEDQIPALGLNASQPPNKNCAHDNDKENSELRWLSPSPAGLKHRCQLRTATRGPSEAPLALLGAGAVPADVMRVTAHLAAYRCDCAVSPAAQICR